MGQRTGDKPEAPCLSALPSFVPLQWLLTVPEVEDVPAVAMRVGGLTGDAILA